jgi:hypothetical protein
MNCQEFPENKQQEFIEIMPATADTKNIPRVRS